MSDPTNLLTQAQLDRLAELLGKAGSTMNIERFDGFTCAVVMGPELISMNEYLSVALGSDRPVAELLSDEESRELLELVLEHWNSIVTQLDAGKVYEPVFIVDDEGLAKGVEWCQGFLQGVDLRKDSWKVLVDDYDAGSSIYPIIALAHENHPDPELTFESPNPEEREALLQRVIAGLVVMHEFFRKRRAAALALDPPATVRRSDPKIGRNEPCPCGSGKKYKHCCLRKVH
jgi:uncharacterized protein